MKRKQISIITILASIVLGACEATPTPVANELSEVDQILTASVGTLSASIFQTQTALAPIYTDTAIPTDTLSPTPYTLPAPIDGLPTSTATFGFVPVLGTSSLSPTVTGTLKTPTPNPSSLAFGCNNLLLIRDETIPAGTVMKPGEKFTKTWKVENNGTCNWVYLYRLVFTGGAQMDGDPSGLGKVIEPNKWTQLSVVLYAPKNPGTYIGYWRFGDQSGNAFGSTLVVSIVVSPPTSTPKPTNTPAPTQTPSNTPLPTDTPVPSNTPTETPTNTVPAP